jgi:hypothetical protein
MNLPYAAVRPSGTWVSADLARWRLPSKAVGRERMGEAGAGVALYAAASLGQRLSKLRFITVAKAECSGQIAPRFGV